ncbi:MAG: hypothetical protein JWO36_4136 [Myxococcales bacterium]|nr:hypothetical protein [Myxococcales bacterium]
MVRCGGYRVTIRRGRIRVRCGVCGPAQNYSPRAARFVADWLTGPLGRFETTAPREERFRLAELLVEAAREVVRRGM